ncbi:DNA topoisomerase III [Caviibacterium pharyngocola]|uniref:DNA topoisomerase n=1 Tax=Caviibacterium pharyngocola TaxID=28159 RepID=A0A2M8RV59_9PAST|nr:DNA topoisomerase III [Caviibacterium pharyngocola]PJG82764.1 DNA topoisomerase III [Caviibacterium pharyngocola]
MKLFLCEKPSQGNDIGKVLGATKRGDGCLATPDGQIIVTWGVGHLVEQFNPEDYDPALKQWTFETLPIIPSQWKLAPKKETKKQYNVVMGLLKKANAVIIATDIDREGETIARELLDLANFRGKIQRLWLSALDDASIRKALGQLKSNQETLPLYYAGLARSRADWLVGINFSRLFTLLAKQKGYQGVLSVGRVQTPTLAMVVQRDLDIANFVSKNHYILLVQLANQAGQFMAQYQIPDNHCDEDGLCLNSAVIQQANQAIRQAGSAKVLSVETKREKESPPLLFSLSSLQTTCNRLFGFGAQQVLDIAQSLYETHKATTYPRTDCGYLPESQLAEVPKVIQALATADPQLKPIVSKLDSSLKSRAWNDKKISAHHGIIPTFGRVDISKMNDSELKVYQLVRLHYLAQFLPPCETDKTVATFESGGHSLIAHGNVMVKPGWKSLLGKTLEENTDETKQGLPPLNVNQQCKVVDTEVKSLQTQPPKPYNEGTLLSAMKNAARFVTDPRLKQQLRETEGLGTEATRAPTIEGLFKRGYLVKKGKNINASAEGVALVNSLPTVLKDPGLTALWEQALNQIAEGTLSLDDFMAKQSQFIRYLMKQCMEQGMQIGNIEVRKCPECGKPMRKIKHEKGTFWGCTGYPQCQHKEADKTTKSKQGSSRKQGTRNVSVSDQLKQLRQHLN